MRPSHVIARAVAALCLLWAMTAVAELRSGDLQMQQLGQQPVAFTKNLGQWDAQVLFRANAGAATIWFTRDGVYYQFTRRLPTAKAAAKAVFSGIPHASVWEGGAPKFMVGAKQDQVPHALAWEEPDSLESIMIRASFVDASPDPHVVGMGEMEYKCNYFIGNDPNHWHTDVPNYEYVLYEGVYPGIDLKYYGDGNQLEYDLVVSPGADPGRIKIRYEGAKSLSVNQAGELEIETAWNTVMERLPIVYQETAAGRREVAGSYRLTGKNTFGFTLGKEYDSSQPLTIDPSLVYSTYLGGGSDDWGYAIAVDASGNAYVTGRTQSTDFPTENPYQTDQVGVDVFVTKLSHSGSNLVYSTYLGGDDTDQGQDIVVDPGGNAYVAGSTYSSDFPTENPYQTDQGGYDVFVTKLSSSGDSLIYSTYLGGGDSDRGCGIAVDGGTNVYVTGWTFSSDFPTENPFQTDQSEVDAYVTKLSDVGNSLIYSTYLGGGSDDWGIDIAVDTGDNAYVTGVTSSSDFPTENPYQTDQGDADVFVSKLSYSGNSLVYSTYLGGAGSDEGSGIAVDTSDNTYVTGTTYSSDFPTENPYQTDQDDADVFVSKLSYSGNSLVYSTYLGGGVDDFGRAIAVDSSCNAYVTGTTFSSNFPTKNPYQADQGSADVFVTKLNNSGDGLIYSTYVGGADLDYGSAIVVDAGVNAYVTGDTYSSDFPTENPYQTDQVGYDVFVAKVSAQNYLCGDTDGNDIVNISDAVYLISYIFGGGPPPDPLPAGDVNCDGIVNVSDAVSLIAYIFGGGPAPCDPDDNGVPDC